MSAAAPASAPASDAVEHYRRAWREARASLPGAGVGWVERTRRDALDRFCERGFPTPRDEDWKYTSVRPIERRPFRLGPAPARAAEGAAGRADGSTPGGVSAGVSETMARLAGRRIAGLGNPIALTFVNGWFAGAPPFDPSGAAPAGVRVASLARVLESEPETVEPHLAADAGAGGGAGRPPASPPASARGAADDDPFAALNRAFLADGAVVSLGAGVRLERPIELVFAAAAGRSDVASHPFVLVLAEAGAAATVVEHYVGFGEGTKLANPFTRIVVGEGAEIEHHLLLEEDAATWHVGSIEAQVAPGGRLGSNAVQLGGRLVRYGIGVSLDGPGARASLNGFYAVRGRQHVDFHTRVDHREPGGTSEQVYKGLLDGHGRGVFNGRVVVHRDAQHSDASQSNHNLLLSENAEIDTKPQLEIFADDVKCSHGATVGQLDERAVHYVRSRGLGEAAARALLTFGFAEDVLARMGEAAIRRHVEHGLAGALPALAGLPARDDLETGLPPGRRSELRTPNPDPAPLANERR